MLRTFFDAPSRTWAVLIGATLAAYLSAVGNLGADYRVSGSAVLLIGFAKVRIIGLHFMDIAKAGRPIRLIFELWLLGLLTTLVLLFWIGSAAPA